MSLGLPPMIPQAELQERFDVGDEVYGIRKVLTHGISDTNGSLGAAHPLQISEKMYASNKHQMNMAMLRNTQGLHAPMRIAMELKATQNIGRLPFLPSSNLMRDVLLGRDEEMSFEDVLNTPEYREEMGQPHAVMEKYQGIL